MVSVIKSLCSGSERIRRGRPPSGRKNPKLASPQAVLAFDNEMHLPMRTTTRRCAYFSTKGVQVRSDI